MSGDYSRVRYSPHRGYIATLEQQGRVRLDAEANELVESMDRRRRAEAIDTIGRGVIPTTTKNAFLITAPSGPGADWTIGQGRAYVDGILADCWGDLTSPMHYEADLGELIGSAALAYSKQPFYYTPNFPSVPQLGWAIVYLDVWEREVTALEDQYLLEPALEQIDTANRLQAAWQVKALPVNNVNNLLCSDNPCEWKNLIARSDGWLTTALQPAPASGSPCIIDPQGGYTGLENRLYRIQISQGGAYGSAQFVYSKNNACLGAVVKGVTKISATESQLSVSTTGKDKSFTFKINDWVEVLDDNIEWSQRETNQGGQILQVTNVNPGQMTINVNADVSGWFSGNLSNPRIRKWEANQQPVSSSTPTDLGDGITVTFGPTTATKFCAGDYWVFWARTAIGKIEILNQAPPRGVLHHYMKLAVVNNGTVTQSCRIFWPPPTGCCTVVVEVGDDIQTAVNSLPKKIGGCVCLKAGVHKISKPINLSGFTNLSFHGESIGAIVQNISGIETLIVSSGGGDSAADIKIEAITFEATAPGIGNAIIAITETEGCTLKDCKIQLASGSSTFAACGIYLRDANKLEIRGNQISGVLVGLRGTGEDMMIADNEFSGPVTQDSNGNNISGGVSAIDLPDLTGMVTVTGNNIFDFTEGLAVQTSTPPNPGNPPVTQLHICDNFIHRQGIISSWQGASIFGAPGTMGTNVQQKAYGIISNVAGAVISGNTIALMAPQHGGVLVYGSDIEVRGNTIASSVLAPGSALAKAENAAESALSAAALAEAAAAQAVAAAAAAKAAAAATHEPAAPAPVAAPMPGAASVSGPEVKPSDASATASPAVLSATKPAGTLSAGPTDTAAGIVATGTGGTGTAPTGTVSTISAEQPQPTITAPWPGLPVGIVAYKPESAAGIGSVDPVERCRIIGNLLSGPLKGIVVAAEPHDSISLAEVVDNRIVNEGAETLALITNSGVELAGLGFDFQTLASVFGILTIDTDRAVVARNVISNCTVGIATFAFERGDGSSNSGGSIDGNQLETCTVGLLLYATSDTTVQNSILQDNQIGITMVYGAGITVAGNRGQSSGSAVLVHFLAIFSGSIDFNENSAEGGGTGLMAAYAVGTVGIRANLIESTSGTGILVGNCENSVTIRDNKVSSCGQTVASSFESNLLGTPNVEILPQSGTGPPLSLLWSSPVSSSIAVLACQGTATIAGCEVADTQQSSGLLCADICVQGAGHTRLRDCIVTRDFDGADPNRGLLVAVASDLFSQTGEIVTADVSSNHVDLPHNLSTNYLAVEVSLPLTVVAQHVGPPPPFQEPSCLVFVGNQIVQSEVTQTPSRSVILTADSLAITGNTISRGAYSKAVFPLTINFDSGLSFVGNVISAPGAKVNKPISGLGMAAPSPDNKSNVFQ